jgi:hypothetical protein
MIIKVSITSTPTSDISTQQILLHGKFVEARVDMCVGLEEVDDLLGSDAALEGRLEGLASQTRYHQIRERVFYLHQVLQKGQVHFGTSVGVHFEVSLHDDEFV